MTRNIRGSFCHKCGKPTETAGLCTECRIGSTPWFTCDLRVKNVHCPSCGAIKQVSTWTDTEKDRTELGTELAKTAVHFHPDVKKSTINVSIIEMTVNRSRADISMKGTLYDKPMEGTCSVEVIWHKEQCDRCNRISGSYYEGNIQVRAEGRVPSSFEIETAASIAQQVEDSLQAGGERLSFISETTPTKDGLDIIVGSQHIGLLISKRIVEALGGRYSTHPKLVGEKAGRQLFRITYLVKLPRYRKNDVVKVGSRYYEVDYVESNHIKTTDLIDGSSKSVREADVAKLIGNSRDAESGLVAYADGKTIGIMDPQTHKTVEFQQQKHLIVEAGQHLRLLRDGDQLVIIW
jgi:nonsense-mediated mRNA decay protein 3